MHGGGAGICEAAGSTFKLFFGFYCPLLLERGNSILFRSLFGYEGLSLARYSTQGRLRGALTSQEIAKYVEHCLKPGKVPGPDKCPDELLKTISDEEFLIVQA